MPSFETTKTAAQCREAAGRKQKRRRSAYQSVSQLELEPLMGRDEASSSVKSVGLWSLLVAGELDEAARVRFCLLYCPLYHRGTDAAPPLRGGHADALDLGAAAAAAREAGEEAELEEANDLSRSFDD
mmetsp:Transcript_9830/g.14643  ORF Transcript_9830/g.14643 Transcript_9830/m.14643 type:complete len:128 (-) Transcript_9830:197-580(-)